MFVAASSSSGGRFIPIKPVLVFIGNGQFSIDPYDSSLDYRVSSGTRSGSTIVPVGTSSPVTLIAYAPKGIMQSTSSICEWRNITTSQVPYYGYGQTGWTYTWCTGTCPNGAGCRYWANGDPFCQNATYGNDALLGYNAVEDTPPMGFAKAYGQWWSTS